jgi:hypothetical protein
MTLQFDSIRPRSASGAKIGYIFASDSQESAEIGNIFASDLQKGPEIGNISASDSQQACVVCAHDAP